MNNHRSLNIEVATRQCFGGMFEKTSTDQRLVQTIMSGTLHITPHPAWLIPDKLDWTEDPFDQRNWRAQLHMLRWLDPLRRAGIDGDIDAGERWIAVVKSWVTSNPANNSAADFAWADMVEAIRAMCMVFGLPLAGEENGWLLDSIWQHGEWLADSAHIGKANHALHQHQALFVIGRLFGNDAWTEAASSRLLELFSKSYDEQGVNDEGSLGYHKNNYIWWRTAIRRLDVEGIPAPTAVNRLDLALTELAHATRPDGKLELIGDTETTTLGSISSPQIDYVKSAGAVGQPPTNLSKVYNAGYVFGRSGWGEYERDFADELYYSLSFGAQDRIHGHCDGGSFTLHSNGQPWLVDSGKYGYKVDAMREYCLSRQGHNVVVIEGATYDPSTVVELLSHSLTSDLDEFIFRDTGYEGVELLRHVVYSRAGDFFVVIDTITSSQGPVTAKQRWHLDDETKSVTTRKGYQLMREGGTADIQWSGNFPELSVISGQDEPFDGWISTSWMERRSAEVLQATKTGERFRFITLISAAKSLTLEKVSSSAGTISVSAGNGRNHFDLAIGASNSSMAVRAVGAVHGSTVSEIRRQLEQVLPLDLPLPQEIAGVHKFTSNHWKECKLWVATQGQPYDARLRILEHLLSLLSQSAMNDNAADLGLRSAIIDVAGADIGPSLGLTDASFGLLREPLIEWPGAVPLVSRTYKSPVNTVTAPEEMFDPDSSARITTAHVGALLLPFLTRSGSSDKLVVKFHGALNRVRSTLPMFQGLNSSLSTSDSFMIFQDPCLDLNRSMSLSWFLGDSDHNIHESCARYIRETQNRVGAREIVLTGNSGGGFTALQVAAFLPDAKVLVFNPQTDIRAYHAFAAEAALKTCFGQTIETLDPFLEARTSAISAYKRLAVVPQVLYVQNRGDIHHVKHHRDPFEIMLREDHPDQRHRVRFVDEDWGPGHVSPTAERLQHFQALLGVWQPEAETSLP
ncbi:heparinase II/III domain-containing protein [Arthrobacter yangruifuii]|uniref:heparinase II/III domain-containing protein n=1 Tax=Arthrobacter yangruifuii TaxID=2606616 RepID=UPI0011B46728|nr:heparinase II/III family protein [Arthrobacter yangruifuii]